MIMLTRSSEAHFYPAIPKKCNLGFSFQPIFVYNFNSNFGVSLSNIVEKVVRPNVRKRDIQSITLVVASKKFRFPYLLRSKWN